MHLWQKLDVGPSVSTSLSSYSWGFDILYIIGVLLYKQHLQSYKFLLNLVALKHLASQPVLNAKFPTLPTFTYENIIAYSILPLNHGKHSAR